MFIKPSSGLIVRDPRTMQPLPPDGAEVGDHDAYWHFHLTHGDVVLVTAPSVYEASAPPAPDAA